MSDLIIKIGDSPLDLSSGETIAITKQAAKVGDFSTVLADGTNEVTISLSAINKAALDNAHLMTSDSEKPYGRLDATLIQEGYETIQDGFAIIKSSDSNFSLQVVGGNAGFFSLIKDEELRALPFDEYSHFWTNQNVFDLRNETEGLIYAVFEQSGGVPTMTTFAALSYAVETEMLLPSFYIKTLVDLIFAAQGYTFVTDIVNEDIYDKAVWVRGAVPNRGTDMSYHACTIRNGLDQSDFYYPLPVNIPIFNNATIDPPTNTYTAEPIFLVSLQEISGWRFRMTDACSFKVNASIIIDNPAGASALQSPMKLTVQCTSENGIVSFQSNGLSLLLGTNTYDFEVDCTCTMDENGSIYFIPTLEFQVGFFLPLTFKQDSTYTVSDVVLIANAPVTSVFPFNYFTGVTMIADIKQGDFMKELARIYQWVFDTDETTHTVTAKRFDQIKENTINALDFSDKIDERKIKTTYGIDGFAQTNALRYKEDQTKYDAVGYINVDDTTLKAEGKYVTMTNLAASSTILRFDTVNAPNVPLFLDALPTNGQTDRILLVKRVTPFLENVNFNRDSESPYANLPTDDLTFAYFTEAGNNDSLDFPTLIVRFYQTVVAMTFRGKTVDCEVNLKIKDVMNYDPFLPVYISHFGNYFYWEKLSNYVKDKKTKCKFIKL